MTNNCASRSDRFRSHNVSSRRSGGKNERNSKIDCVFDSEERGTGPQKCISRRRTKFFIRSSSDSDPGLPGGCFVVDMRSFCRPARSGHASFRFSPRPKSGQVSEFRVLVRRRSPSRGLRRKPEITTTTAKKKHVPIMPLPQSHGPTDPEHKDVRFHRPSAPPLPSSLRRPVAV